MLPTLVYSSTYFLPTLVTPVPTASITIYPLLAISHKHHFAAGREDKEMVIGLVVVVSLVCHA